MKKMTLFWIAVTALFAVAACSTDDSWYNESWTQNQTSTTTESNDDNKTTTNTVDDDISGASTSGDVTSFTVAINKSALAETYKVDASDDDYFENTTFDKTITITFSTSTAATVEGDDTGVVSVNGNDVTAVNSAGDIILLSHELLPLGCILSSEDGGVVLCLEPLTVAVLDVGRYVLDELTEGFHVAIAVYHLSGYILLHPMDSESREHVGRVQKSIAESLVGRGYVSVRSFDPPIGHRLAEYAACLLVQVRLNATLHIDHLAVDVQQSLGDSLDTIGRAVFGEVGHTIGEIGSVNVIAPCGQGAKPKKSARA